jgi:uncharacterized cupin superfamily protein
MAAMAAAFNLYDGTVERDADDPQGYEAGYRRLGLLLGAERIGATLYELEQGNSNCPYHYEYGNEEWLLCVSGTPTLRTPEGEHDLRPGDVVCFVEGPAGAHKITNNAGETARYVIWSTLREPSLAVYPDSDKIGVWPGLGNNEKIIVRRESNVDYWEGE